MIGLNHSMINSHWSGRSLGASELFSMFPFSWVLAGNFAKKAKNIFSGLFTTMKEWNSNSLVCFQASIGRSDVTVVTKFPILLKWVGSHFFCFDFFHRTNL